MLTEDQAALAQTFEGGAPITMDSFLVCATELDANGVDAVVVDLPVAQELVTKYQGFIILDEVLGNEQYGILYRAGDEELCKKMDEAVMQLVQDGTYLQLVEKYGLEKEYFTLRQAAE